MNIYIGIKEDNFVPACIEIAMQGGLLTEKFSEETFDGYTLITFKDVDPQEEPYGECVRKALTKEGIPHVYIKDVGDPNNIVKSCSGDCKDILTYFNF